MPSQAAAAARRRARQFSRSLLFIPTLLMAGALLLFVGTSWVDRVLAAAGAADLNLGPWHFLVFTGSPSAAESVLSAVATMWAGILGVAFSVTLVALGLSATKYSAGVVVKFQSDRLNQTVLGVFASTVVYSLLVLRTVRVPGQGTGFTPIVGVNVAVLLAVLSLFFLVLLIQNIADYVQPKRFVDGAKRAVVENLPHLQAPEGVPGYRPGRDERAHRRREGPRDAAVGTEHPVASPGEGYVQDLDWRRLRKALAGIAPPAGGEVRLRIGVKIGDHVSEGEPIAFVSGPQPLSAAAAEGLAAAFLLQDERSPEGDPEFAMANLVDIGVTSMSGGTMDPGVAQACIRQQFVIARRLLAAEDPVNRFHVATPAGDVLMERPPIALLPILLHGARTVHEKALREGLTPVLEEGLHEGCRLLVAAVREGRLDHAEEILDWVSHAFRDIAGASSTRWHVHHACEPVAAAAVGLRALGRADLAEELVHRAEQDLSGLDADGAEEGRRLLSGALRLER